MSAPTLALALGDPALALQLAQWLDDEGIAHRSVDPGHPVDASGCPRAWLTDATTLRAGSLQAAVAAPATADAGAALSASSSVSG